MEQVKRSIAADLKAAGYNSKQVSVRSNPAGYSTSIKITIRDPMVVYSAVEEIERKYTRIDRDERSYEILSGGNTFVDTKLTDEVRESWSANYLPLITKAISELKDEQHGVRIDARFTIFRNNRNDFKVWDEYDSWLRRSYYRAEDLAVDLYILTTGAQANVTHTAIFRYWSREISDDKNRWQDTVGEYSPTAMGEAAAVHFKCASEQGDTQLEKEIFDWAIDFVSQLAKRRVVSPLQ
jgi:hypothetical protein